MLHQIGIRDTFSITDYIDAIRVTSILNIPAKNDGCILLIKLQHIADSTGLLTGHQCAAAAAEGINDNTVFLAGIADRITQQV